jgi:serine/threonine protein kinase
MSATSRLIHQKMVSAGHKVSVWREESLQKGIPIVLYRKSWQCDFPKQADAWLSWARHEHLLLSLLAGRGAQHAVAVSDLHVDHDNIELVTRDAGPELQRDWLLQRTPKLQSESELLTLSYHCLVALQEIHRMGIVHGDFKADNLCIPAQRGLQAPDISQLQLIDFAFSLSRDYPLRFVLPIDPDRIDYLPQFYKSAIRQAQVSKQPEPIQKVCCAEIDLFSLGVMMEKIISAMAPQGPHAWSTLLHVVMRCKEVGSQKPNALQRLLRKDFAQPTHDMLREVKQLLDSLPALTQAAQAAPKPLNTPIATPLATPLAPSPATPLATPLALPSAQAPVIVKRPIQSPSLEIPRSQKRWQWLIVSTLLGYLFFRIDLIYKREGLLINDTGYYLGLSVMALSLMLAWGTLRSWRQPTHRLNQLLTAVSGWMALSTLYFFITLREQGVSWLECFFF